MFYYYQINGGEDLIIIKKDSNETTVTLKLSKEYYSTKLKVGDDFNLNQDGPDQIPYPFGKVRCFITPRGWQIQPYHGISYELIQQRQPRSLIIELEKDNFNVQFESVLKPEGEKLPLRLLQRLKTFREIHVPLPSPSQQGTSKIISSTSIESPLRPKPQASSTSTGSTLPSKNAQSAISAQMELETSCSREDNAAALITPDRFSSYGSHLSGQPHAFSGEGSPDRAPILKMILPTQYMPREVNLKDQLSNELSKAKKSNKNPLIPLQAAYNALYFKLKIIETKKTEPKYKKVYEIINTLYNELGKATDLQTIEGNIAEALVNPELNNPRHNSFIGSIVFILNLLAALVTVNIKGFSGNDWRFFGTQTETGKVVEQLKEVTDEAIRASTPGDSGTP